MDRPVAAGAGPGRRPRPGAARVRQAAGRAPGHPVDAGGLGHRASRGAPDGPARGVEDRSGPRSPPGDLDDQGVRGGGAGQDRGPGPPGPRRTRHLRGDATGALLPGRPRRPHLRRPVRGAPHGHRAEPDAVVPRERDHARSRRRPGVSEDLKRAARAATEKSREDLVELIERGAFDGVHAAMMVHPAPFDVVEMPIIAAVQFEVRYTGKEAHTSAFPELGINAADALVVAQSAIGLLRQHLRPTDRVHGIVTKGGDAPNVVPAHTSAMYMVRAETLADLDQVREKVVRCFEAGALATGATLDVEPVGKPYAEMRHA